MLPLSSPERLKRYYQGKETEMGYLRKGMVINALREDMKDTQKCYEYYREKELIEFCYNCMERVIDRLPQYYPENAVEETRWIPISERLPEEEEYILLSFENYTGLGVGRYEKDGENDNFYPGDEEEAYASYGLIVNAWMPLPKPYKEREKMNNQRAIDRLTKHLEWGWSEETVAAIGMGIHALKETQWIPCSERLPVEQTDVLVTVKYNGFIGMYGTRIKTGFLDEYGWNGDCFGGTVVAWMPLPEPYKEQENG